MRQPIPLTDEMYEELVTLRENGMGLRPLGEHFGVSHQTIRTGWILSALPASIPTLRVRLKETALHSGER